MLATLERIRKNEKLLGCYVYLTSHGSTSARHMTEIDVTKRSIRDA